jgi:hypothetical protein
VRVLLASIFATLAQVIHRFGIGEFVKRFITAPMATPIKPFFRRVFAQFA